MVRRNRNRAHGASRRKADVERIPSLGSHWRSDGRPKATYRNQGDALTAANVQRQEYGVELNVYRCDMCSGWHMGNPSRRDS
jgi:hypothetical protein